MLPNSNTRYSRSLLALVALVLIAISLCELANQSVPASAVTSLIPNRTPTPCHPPKCTPTPKPTRTHTPTPTLALTTSPTLTPTLTPTATPTPTQTPTASIASTALPQSTVTPDSTPVAGNTPTPTQTTQTVGNGNPPPSDGGNSGGGSSIGSMFTTIALITGVLAFLLYLIPRRGASSSILNKILSLILPSSVVRRMDDE
jgi:hypothetical protein